MTFELLPVMLANATEDLHECVPQVARGAFDTNQLLAACRIARRAGILALFVDGDFDELHRHLSASAQMFLHGAGAQSRDALVASRCTPLLDAMAARADNLALALAAVLLQLPQRPGKEGAADHAWYRFLALATEHSWSEERMNEVLEQATRALDAADDARVVAGRALIARDAAGLEGALHRLAIHHESRWTMRFAKGAVGEDEFASEGRLYVEGLALLGLADRRGMSTEFEHACLPDEARRRSPFPVEADAWRTITET